MAKDEIGNVVSGLIERRQAQEAAVDEFQKERNKEMDLDEFHKLAVKEGKRKATVVKEQEAAASEEQQRASEHP